MKLHTFMCNHRFGYDTTKKNKPWSQLEYKDFERATLTHILNNQFTIIKKSRQMYMTSMLVAYVAWYLKYNKSKQTDLFYVSPKYKSSQLFVKQVKTLLDAMGVDEFVHDTTSEIELKNGNRLIIITTQVGSLCGYGQRSHMAIIDEAAFIDKLDYLVKNIHVAMDTETKIVITSTPNGFNGFYKIYVDAERGDNQFIPLLLHYTQNPKYGKEWVADMRKLFDDELKFKQEIEAEFVTIVPKLEIPRLNKTESNSIKFRLDDSTINEIGLKLIEKDINMSTYIRELIKKDLKK